MILLLRVVQINAAEVTESGLVQAKNVEKVEQTCGICHSLKLVIQNRANRKNWKAMIRWMQTSQGLWPLGENEDDILDYLVKYYGPSEVFRREPIQAELMPPIAKKLAN